MVSLVHNGGAAPAAGVPLTGDGGATTAAMVSGSGSGEGSSSTATVNASQRSPLRTLDDVMRAPSATLPDVIVLEGLPDGLDRREVLDPKEDLWLSTADGYVWFSIVDHPCVDLALAAAIGMEAVLPMNGRIWQQLSAHFDIPTRLLASLISNRRFPYLSKTMLKLIRPTDATAPL